MFHSLLVPLDGTRFSEHALPLAGGIARATGAALHLARVHVPHPPDGLLSNTQFQYEGVDMEEYEGHVRDAERAYLRDMVGRLAESAPVAVDAALLEGDVADRLEDHARVTEADAVILTTHARAGMSRVWLGSVAEALIRATTIPVLALRCRDDRTEPHCPPIRNLLVPLDGSALAEAILTPAADLAYALGAHVTLLHVVHSGAMGRARTAEAETYLHRIRQRLLDRDLHVHVCVTSYGAPAEAICRSAQELGADLVALATHGRTGLGRALLGSVTLDVLHGSELPLLVRRPALA